GSAHALAHPGPRGAIGACRRGRGNPHLLRTPRSAPQERGVAVVAVPWHGSRARSAARGPPRTPFRGRTPPTLAHGAGAALDSLRYRTRIRVTRSLQEDTTCIHRSPAWFVQQQPPFCSPSSRRLRSLT